MLQWISRGTLGRTGSETMEVKLPPWPSCETTAGMQGALAWDGWGAGLEPVGRICGQCFGGCLLLPSDGRSNQGFLQTSGVGFTYACSAPCGRL